MSGGERIDHGEPIKPRAASAVSPWLFLRRSRPDRRKENEPFENAEKVEEEEKDDEEIAQIYFGELSDLVQIQITSGQDDSDSKKIEYIW